ncbi:NAD(P)H-dependent oxidoreductase [Kiloniella antarctica]|uniref:NAD(P)H-dependent oxidoreductase n=1 Tax=Kiloniella antarctica TaxID=1550907 RepID=A0ABW5BKI0_9PROT
MNCLIVVAHPLESSLCQHLARETTVHMREKGHIVTVKDLYDEAFDPRLSQQERSSYYQAEFQSSNLGSNLDRDLSQLKEAEILVMVFPTWWFGFPAILKGWFDRVWAPGHAYDHSPDLKGIIPRLDQLKEVNVITTLGSPGWVDWLILRRPVRRILKIAILGTCAKNCNFKMLSLYSSESLTPAKIDKFIKRIKRAF